MTKRPVKPAVAAPEPVSRVDDLRDLRRIILDALRVDGARKCEECGEPRRAEPGQIAALSKELRAVDAELDGMAAPREVSILDDLANKRAARLSATADPAPSARRGQPRRSNGGHRVS